ncbi:MAG TPA: Uma2 family endonuclease [Gemmataceae bacterium]|jgi:Uma2 family endonuclease
MSTIVPPLVNLGSMPPLPVRRFTVDEYHRMIQSGIIPAGERCELLDGWIVLKMTRSPLHDLALGLAEDEIGRRLPQGWFRRDQSAVTVTESEPEPDLAVVRGRRRDFDHHHPGPADIGMIVEIADPSLAQDRTVKGSLYARDGIPIYWIVNLVDRILEVYTDPTGPDPVPAYRRRQDYQIGDQVTFVLDGTEIDRIPVADLLP